MPPPLGVSEGWGGGPSIGFFIGGLGGGGGVN